MQRNLWRKQYSSYPSLPCPRCSKGLKLQKDSKQTYEPSYSKIDHGEEGWTPYQITARFTALLQCHNAFCGEVVTVTGAVDFEEHQYYDGEEMQVDINEYMRPKFLYPAPPVIKVSQKLSDDCKRLLRSSFEQLWVDEATCANRLRSFVEHLLDQLGISREGTRPDGSIFEKKLAVRIDEVEKQKPGHKSALNALRNVGNLGTHGTKLKFDTVLDAFELLENALDDLVDGKQARLDALSLKLSDKKGQLK